MGFATRPLRARLQMESLEDRTTPAKLDEALSLALPELVATGAVAGDRVNVVMTAETNTAADAAALAATPFAYSVQSLGFGIYSVTLTPGTDLTQAIEFYGRFAGVVSAAPDQIVQLQRTPNDPSYGSLYGMTRIGAPAAWDVTTGNPNFVVAVIDTGVDYNHPDLAANMWRNPGETAGDGIDNDGNGFVDDIFGADFANNDGNPMDDNNHGTHVAGTIGAVGNNGVGVAGVNWGAKIMALKFLSASGSGATSNAVRALDYAVAKGAKVSNNSWGGGGADSTLAAAIGRARAAGHIFVAAAGNAGTNNDAAPNWPSNYSLTYDNVVAVAATGSTDALASFSNYGATSVTLAAPGVSILSTTRNNTYSSFSGTSMATPHVAGAIALYWGANPGLTYQQVIAKLKSSVDPVAGLAGKVSTGGRLNVANMFASSPPTVPPPPTVAPGPRVTAATFGGTTTQFNRVTVTFDRAVNASTFTAADVASFTGPNGVNLLGAVTGVAAVSGTNNQFVISFAAQSAGGNYALTFGPDVRDALGNPMNQDGDGLAGETTGDRYTATGTLIQNVTRTFATPLLSLAINDFQTTVSSFNVTDDIRIGDLNAAVTLTHTYDSDLTITLTSPRGTTVTLFNRRGGSGDNLTNTRFDDEATVAIANGAAPFSGTYRPDGLLSAFDGQSTRGVWTLRVADGASRDTGRLTGWSITVAGTIGGPSGSALAFGFEDAAPADVAALDDPAPVGVEASTPLARVSLDAVPAADPVAGLFVWADERTGPSTAAAPPVSSDDFAERENRPALTDGAAAPAPSPYAALYFFAPSDPAGDEDDVFEALAVD